MERRVQRLEAALAGPFLVGREINAGGDADGADVHHVRLVAQRHHGVGPFRFHRPGALEQAFLAVDVEGGETGRAGQRMRRVGVAVEQFDDVARALHE